MGGGGRGNPNQGGLKEGRGVAKVVESGDIEIAKGVVIERLTRGEAGAVEVVTGRASHRSARGGEACSCSSQLTGGTEAKTRWAPLGPHKGSRWNRGGGRMDRGGGLGGGGRRSGRPTYWGRRVGGGAGKNGRGSVGGGAGARGVAPRTSTNSSLSLMSK